MLTLDAAKAHLKLDPTDTSEDVLLQGYVDSVQAAFEIESKRRWPVEGEPALVTVLDPTTVPPTTRFVGYVDPAVLSEKEQKVAGQWLRLVLGHWYENRGSVAVGLNLTEVPQTAKMLMNLVRVPTL
ncbi:head-tail connector protein [Hymenobacter sp. BT559]|jgi:hypothetical protein|uniref:head-tail connector protein n=1 Tax=Hymenobacter sp. BT559 TaxID=2795729 RepID=UPI0018EAB777|nr:head-tail connector protein [Hymenobacter sp. BT559]MBJ6145734.1 phage gp6-like head-tail connector protein [Hymenobacter sp. BT559]